MKVPYYSHDLACWCMYIGVFVYYYNCFAANAVNLAHGAGLMIEN